MTPKMNGAAEELIRRMATLRKKYGLTSKEEMAVLMAVGIALATVAAEER